MPCLRRERISGGIPSSRLFNADICYYASFQLFNKLGLKLGDSLVDICSYKGKAAFSKLPVSYFTWHGAAFQVRPYNRVQPYARCCERSVTQLMGDSYSINQVFSSYPEILQAAWRKLSLRLHRRRAVHFPLRGKPAGALLAEDSIQAAGLKDRCRYNCLCALLQNRSFR